MDNGIQEFRDRLQAARRQLLERVLTTDTELVTLEGHQAGSLGEDAVTELAATVLSRVEGLEKHELDEIGAALARLESGTFGLCEECGASIPLVRLRAMPAVRYCLNCQMRRET